MPRGHSLSIYARFSGKKRGKRRSLLNPNTAQRSFFPITGQTPQALRTIASSKQWYHGICASLMINEIFL